MTGLRVLRARAFVHVGTQTTKMGDKAWEKKARGFSPNSRSWGIYHTEKETVVDSRNVKFVEPPQDVRRMQKDAMTS